MSAPFLPLQVYRYKIIYPAIVNEATVNSIMPGLISAASSEPSGREDFLRSIRGDSLSCSNLRRSSIQQTLMAYAAQNRGAGKIKRMKEGFLSSIILQVVYTTVIALLVFFGSRQIMQLFVSDGSEEVISLGVSYLQLIAFMYYMPSATNIIQGYFRGLGDLKVTLISTVLNMSARFLSAWLMIHIMHGGFDRLAWANFVGWIAMLAFQIPMITMRWRKVK